MTPPPAIDINKHLDLIKIVVSSMPRARWLLSPDVFPQLRTEGWLAMREALDHFDPSKGSPDKTPDQQFRVFAPDYIKKAVRKWQVRKWKEQAGWYESLESYDEVAARPLTPGNYKGVTARPRTPGDFMGVTNDPNEYNELMQMLLEQIDELPERLRDVVLRIFQGKSGKEIAAELGKSVAVVSERKTLGLQKVRAGVHRARQNPMKPQTVAEVDAQIDMVLPVAANVALERQYKDTMSIAGFEVESRIGTGGHAEVWLARKRGAAGSDRLVALKRLLPEWTASAEAKRRFEKEVRTSSKLSHQNIVYYDTCVSDKGSLALVMEYIDGRDLAQLRDGRLLSRNAAVYLVEQVLAGLRHAHGRGIVHRDIKPSNILISRDGAVKVSDFGIAQAAVTAHLTLVRSDVTQGTPDWMSPEHKAGERVDERSDLYAVGLVLEKALHGRLDTELKAYVEKLTRPAPEDRFQSAREALEALPKCDHRQATLELRAHVRGEAIPVDEAHPVAELVAPPSTATVTSPHAVSVVPPSTSRWANNPIALLVVLLLLFVGSTGVLVGQLWTGEAETPSPVEESVSEPAPAVVPASERVPAVAPVAELPSVVVIREVQNPEPQPAKRRSTKRPPAQPTKRLTERARQIESDDEAIQRVLNRPMPPNPYPAQPTKRATKRYIWPESDDEAIQRVLNRPMPPNPYRNKRGNR